MGEPVVEVLVSTCVFISVFLWVSVACVILKNLSEQVFSSNFQIWLSAWHPCAMWHVVLDWQQSMLFTSAPSIRARPG